VNTLIAEGCDGSRHVGVAPFQRKTPFVEADVREISKAVGEETHQFTHA
jgi:hypothetical protein